MPKTMPKNHADESVAVGYILHMASKLGTRYKRRRTTMVPGTIMEEIPVLSTKELAELRASLQQAEARLKAGKGIDYDPKAFKDRLIGIYREGKDIKHG